MNNIIVGAGSKPAQKERIEITISSSAIEIADGKAPEWMLLYKEGINEIDGAAPIIVDRASFNTVIAGLKYKGNDVVIDYEHQTIKGIKAPAAGWIKELKYVDGSGIMARVEWTDEASGYVAKREYRYFSPVSYSGKNDKKLVAIHSVALTNVPRTNNLTPIVAKNELDILLKQEENMDLALKVREALGLAPESTDDEVLAAITAMKKSQTTQTAAKTELPAQVLEALNLKVNDDVSVVVASIHALNQNAKQTVSKAEFDALKSTLDEQNTTAIVASAMAAGKITPDQKEWAVTYAKNDLKGFQIFVAKAPQVIPINKLNIPAQQASDVIDDQVLTVAKQMGVSPEDLKKYGQVTAP